MHLGRASFRQIQIEDYYTSITRFPLLKRKLKKLNISAVYYSINQIFRSEAPL